MAWWMCEWIAVSMRFLSLLQDHIIATMLLVG
jgi:hypothetical protein